MWRERAVCLQNKVSHFTILNQENSYTEHV